jgi:SOS-response transcriptional repressor LexA
MLGMGAHIPKRSAARPASVGAAIKARRAFLGINAEDVVELTGGIVSLKLLSKLENNHTSVASLKLGRYRSLLSALQLTPAEFEELTGVTAALPEPEEMPNATAFLPTLRIPIAGTVSAGLRSVNVSDATDHLALDPGLPGLRGRASTNLVALRVNGDSMVSDRASNSIRPGAHVIVELGALPSNGDIVAAWLPDRDTAVIKEFREGSDVVLRSLNPTGPVFRLGEEAVEVRGVVRMILSYP